jgi:prepilin-type N-terminal cleavage/methylation domain-containing protein/prepilin-type processing-associated H-X9-DG protein
MRTRKDNRSPSHQAFTLIELLVVIAVVLILMGRWFSAYASEKPKSKGFQCLNNVRQLSLAWLMYAQDNQDYFLYSSDDGSGNAYATVPSPNSAAHAGDVYAWAWSKMDFSPGNPWNTDPAADIMLRPMWNYNKNASIYKCPGDTSVIDSNSEAVLRVRSYSMNFFLGGFGDNASEDAGAAGAHYPIYTKLTDLQDLGLAPGASKTWLFIEERQDYINWGNFLTDMSGYPVNNGAAMPAAYQWNGDLPGSYHDRAGGISFCDGHAEIHKWLDGSTTPPISLGTSTISAPYSVDVAWLQNASARPH